MSVARRARWSHSVLFSAILALLSCAAILPLPARAGDVDIPELKAAAQKGFVPQEIELAAAYFTGAGVEQDAQMAAYWYRKAAESGDPEAENEIGFLYQTGQGVVPDAGRALHWYQLAAAGGYVKAKVNLGVLYVWGIGVAKDQALAAQLFEEASAKGNSTADSYLGDMYFFGLGVKQDKSMAESWYAAGAKLHDPMSSYNLASLYSVEPDHAHNLRKAVALLRSSVAGGFIPAMHSLGLLLVNHPELANSPGESRELLEQASNAGSWRSSIVLGIMSRDGKNGAADPEAAYYLFQIARIEGREKAAKMLANDLKVLEARVPEARRATLAAEAEQWHRKHPLALAFVYRDGGSKLFPASARAVADEELHAGRLVFPPAA